MGICLQAIVEWNPYHPQRPPGAAWEHVLTLQLWKDYKFMHYLDEAENYDKVVVGRPRALFDELQSQRWACSGVQSPSLERREICNAAADCEDGRC